MKSTITIKNSNGITLISLALVSIIMMAYSLSESAEEKTKLEIPQRYSLDVVAKYRQLGNAGYRALGQGDITTAIESFTSQLNLIPEGKLGNYNLACAYGRTGDIERGIYWLGKTADNGWVNSDDFLNDGDLTALQSSPQFEKIIEKVNATLVEKEKMFAGGLPIYSTPPVTFETIEKFKEWSNEQEEMLRAHESVWHSWQRLTAALDFYAQRLAVEKELLKDDPTYDYALTRVRTIGTIKSMLDCWGPFSDGVVVEAKSYLAGAPPQAGADEANYLVGVASAKKYCTDEHSPEQINANKQARTFFAKVSTESPFFGQSSAWLLTYKLADAEKAGQEVVKALYADVRKLINKFNNDKDTEAMQIITLNFHSAAISSIWPLDINQPDIAGEYVTMDDYVGKVLLIDFWATTCGPCLVELPNLRAVYKKYNHQGFEVLGISLDFEHQLSLHEMEKWTAKRGMLWRHIYEGMGSNSLLAERFMVNSIPSAFLVNRDGSLAAVGESARGEYLEQAVKKALSVVVEK